MLLRTLGGLELEGSEFRRPQPLLLLAYLALEGPRPRRFLAELFWLRSKDPLNRLSVVLSQLRKGARDAIQADPTRVWTDIESDAGKLLAALERGAWQEAVRLYRGPFLEGLQLRDWSAELEEWVYGTREFLAGGVRDALLRLAEHDAACGRFEAAARQAEKALAVGGTATPEPEELERLLRLLVAGESPHAETVRNEAAPFGITAPRSPREAREVLRQLLEASAQRVPQQLPIRGTSFVGRDLELTEVINLLTQPDCRLLTLVGPGGVGKTRLALQVARELVRTEQFPDGVTYVALDALTAASQIPSRLAEALDLSLAGTAEPLEQVQDVLAAKHLLLVLDNFEQLMPGSAVVSALLSACPNLRVLVTSRERLNLEQEWIFPVAGLAYADAAQLEEARLFDAVQLFVQRARRARPDFELSAGNLPAVLTICRLVAGYPLGLELAAVWTKVLSCAEIAAEIEKNLDFLASPARDATPRHQSMRAVFEHSWELLSPNEQDVLARLAVFRGGFRREAAREVAGATIPLLASLVDKSLLRFAATGRYDRHPLLYRYTLERLREQPQLARQCRDAHADYYFRNLIARSSAAQQSKETLAFIEEELDNFRAAWAWALESERVDDLRRCSKRLSSFFEKRGRFHDGVEFLAPALTQLHAGNERHRAALGTILVDLAWLHYRSSNYREARRFARRGLALLCKVDASPRVQSGLKALGSVALETGNYDEARKMFETAVAHATETGDELAASDSLNSLAVLEQKLGHYPEARRYLDEALAIKRRLGDRLGLVAGLNNLGLLTCIMGAPREALPLFEEGLQRAHEWDLRGFVPYLLHNRALAFFELGNYGEADSVNRQALTAAHESGLRSLEVGILALQGSIAIALAHHHEAQQHLERALELAWSIRDLPALPLIFTVVGHLWVQQGEPLRAAELLGLVLVNEFTIGRAHDLAQALQRTLAHELPAAVLAEALERGSTSALEEVVASVQSAFQGSEQPSQR